MSFNISGKEPNIVDLRLHCTYQLLIISGGGVKEASSENLEPTRL